MLPHRRGNWRNDTGTRYSINTPEWKFSLAWQVALHEILEGKVRRYLDIITNMDTDIVIDRLGGDIVEAGCSVPQIWHSDWPSLALPECIHEAAIGISIAVMNITPDMGPIEIVPSGMARGTHSDPASFAVCCNMNKGDVLIRDVRCIHRGGGNSSYQDRLLPGFTLLTRVPRLMDVPPVQQNQLRMLPVARQSHIPIWLRQYFTGRTA